METFRLGKKLFFFSFGNIFLFVSIGGVLWVYCLGLAQALGGIECSINPANIGRICWERATFYRQPSLWLVAFALVFFPSISFSCIGLFHLPSSCLTFEDYNPTFEEYNPTYTNKTNSAHYLTVTLLCKCTTTTTQRQCYFFLPKKLIKPPCFFFLVFCFFLLPFEFWVGDGRLRDGSSSSSSVTSTSSLISFLRATK